MSDFQQEGEINSTDNIISDPANSNVQTSSDNSINAGDVSLREEMNIQFSEIRNDHNVQFGELRNQFSNTDNQFGDLCKMFQTFMSHGERLTSEIQSVKQELVSQIYRH